ncbi:MAG: cytochrome b N-terminal domain-containing protein [Alphaproteobacteria bacterium]
MSRLQAMLRFGFTHLEGWLDRAFGAAWNPLANLGALGFFFYWIVAATGIYIYAFFDTSTTEAFRSVEALTHVQWYFGGIMRSLHRYASDGMVLVLVLHAVRELAFDRYRGARWFSWLTGVPILWLVILSGITGYWLVWDQLAQYIAERSTEWLDWLPIFGEPIARNFLSTERLSDRFFTLLVFLHIAIPLILLLVLWIHLQRVSRPKINPPRGLAFGTFASLMVLSLVKPALSHGPADLAAVPAVLHFDWFYLGAYPFLDLFSAGEVWGAGVTLTVIMAALPWLPPLRRAPAAEVDLANCNGCRRCADDCPFNAITMGPRTDGRPFEQQAVVRPSLCVSCGICAGACPTSTPFRRASALVPGIDLPHLPLREVRTRMEQASAALAGPRPHVLIIGCDHGLKAARLASESVGVLDLPCIGMLPPSFLDYAISRALADGVMLMGCREGECHARLGVEWTEGRLAGTRDPHLRRRVPRERIETVWAAPVDERNVAARLARFRGKLAALPASSAATRSIVGSRAS